MLVLELLGRLGSAVLDCVLDDLRNPIELWSCYQSCSLFSIVSQYIFIWYLILGIKIDKKKRSIAALYQCCWQGMQFVYSYSYWVWGIVTLHITIWESILDWLCWYMSGLAGDIASRRVCHINMVGKGNERSCCIAITLTFYLYCLHL